MTASHLRFGPSHQLDLLVSDADFVACHQFGLLNRVDILDVARDGAIFLLNSLTGPLRCGTGYRARCNVSCRTSTFSSGWSTPTRSLQSPARQPDQHSDAAVLLRLSGILPADEAVPRSRPRSQGLRKRVTPSWTATSPPSTRRLPTSSRWRFRRDCPGGSIGVAVPNRPRTSSST